MGSSADRWTGRDRPSLHRKTLKSLYNSFRWISKRNQRRWKVLQNGSIARLEPETVGYALLWTDGVIQLEIHPETDEQPDEQAQEQAAQTVLLRYLSMRLAGAADAAALLMEPHAADRLPQYDAVVPVRFAPLKAPERFDQCAGIVTRLAPNIARVDTVLAMTAPAGQGRRLIERMELLRTNA